MNTGRRERGRAVSLLLCFLLSLGALFSIAGPVQAQERTGTLAGVATDASGGVLPGVTVTITNNRTGRVTSQVTDGAGRYRAELDPGSYKVAFELSGFARQELPDVEVQLGRAFDVNAQLKVGSVTEAVQVTAENTPLVDTHSTIVAHNVSAEEIDRLPKTRSYQSIALTAPSVNSGELEGGFQVNGASGAENSFTVDGTVTSSLIYGSSRQNTVFEYLQEVQVKTSGISAEYGGALGGVISAVTKSGGNIYRGEAHYYFEGSPLAAGPVRRLVLSPFDDKTVTYAQDKEMPNHQNEFGGSIGGPIIRDRFFFFGAYSPRNETRTNTYNLTDGTQDVERSIWKQQAFGKLSYSGRRFNANWSTLWTPTKATGTHSSYNGPNPNQLTGTISSIVPQIDRGYETNQVNTSGTVDFVLTNASFLRARGAIFHDRYSDVGISSTTPYTYQTPTTPLNSIIPPSLQGGTNVSGVNTPRAQITDFDTTKRRTFDVDYNHSLAAGGLHTFKAGYGFQRVENDINSYYPGGYVDIYWNLATAAPAAPGVRGIYGYYIVNDRKIENKAGSSIHSLYFQDQWQLNNRLTLNLGLRSEHEVVPTFRPDYLENAFVFGWGEKLAPRLGAAYDLRGDGRAKIFGSWGRYYDWTKYELVRGSFGAETWCQYYRGLNTLDLGSINLSNMPGPEGWSVPGTCRDRRVASFQGDIDPETKPMSQDSTSAGLEYQLNGTSVFTVRYIHNDLRTTIEDLGYLTPENNEGYTISNPGRGFTALQYPTGLTPLGQPNPEPIRQYDALELGYNRRFSNNWFFTANYTLSRLWGNYPGTGSSDEITPPTTGQSSATSQQQGGSFARPGSNASRAWDLDELLWDSHGNLVTGRLATDRPHVVKLYGSYLAPFGTQVGAFFYGGSGTPLTTYVMSTNSSGGIGSMVEGRGDMGRTPVLTLTNLLVSHDVRLAGSKRLRFELNVLNLFNQKTTRHVFNGLNRGTGAGGQRLSAAANLSQTDLTKGYDYNALILASPEGQGAYDPRYNQDDLFEEGARAYFTIKYEF
jgi:hypothetical protein